MSDKLIEEIRHLAESLENKFLDSDGYEMGISVGTYVLHVKTLLAEVARLRAEKVQLLGAKNVTIQTPPILESEVVSALRGSVKAWQLEAERLRVQLNAESDVQYAQRQELDALRERLTLTPERVEAAIQARNDYIWRDGGIHAPTESGELRAALLAAGMTEEALQ